MLASVTVPANLLLMGEYSVLEEGGLGITVAPDVRANGGLYSLTDGPTTKVPRTDNPLAQSMSVTGHMPGVTVRWPGDLGVVGLAAEHLRRRHPLPPRVGYHIELNSDALFKEDGTKRGLGSSAAAVVALTALWLRAAGRITAANCETARTRNLVFTEALDAHRAAQGGKGSGYDVACSTYGGFLVFSGGHSPTARPVDLPWFPTLHLVQGPEPVNTVSAVGRYESWKAREPAAASSFLKEANRLVSEFAAAGDWAAASRLFAEYAGITVALGQKLGVPAVPEVPECLQGRMADECGSDGSAAPASSVAPVVSKAVGAGNEIGVVLGSDRTEGAVTLSTEGLQWS